MYKVNLKGLTFDELESRALFLENQIIWYKEGNQHHTAKYCEDLLIQVKKEIAKNKKAK